MYIKAEAIKLKDFIGKQARRRLIKRSPSCPLLREHLFCATEGLLSCTRNSRSDKTMAQQEAQGEKYFFRVHLKQKHFFVFFVPWIQSALGSAAVAIVLLHQVLSCLCMKVGHLLDAGFYSEWKRFSVFLVFGILPTADLALSVCFALPKRHYSPPWFTWNTTRCIDLLRKD